MSTQRILLIGSSAKGALEYSYLKAAAQLPAETMLFDPAVEEEKYVKGGKIGQKLHLFLPVESWIRKMNRELILLTKKFQPQVILLFTNVRVLPGALASIKTILPQVKIAWIWPDSPLNLEPHNMFNAPLLDMTATYADATVRIFRQMGFPNVHWVPLAGDPFMHATNEGRDGKFDREISFVGTWKPERERVMAQLCENFPDKKIEIYGRYWKRDSKNEAIRKCVKGEGLYEAELAKFFARSRINVNVVEETNNTAPNMRFFEIPTANGLQLTSHCPEMDKEYR